MPKLNEDESTVTLELFEQLGELGEGAEVLSALVSEVLRLRERLEYVESQVDGR